MHIINTDNLDIRTDLIIDNNNINLDYEYKTIKVYNTKKENYMYTTISYIDITDKDQKKIISEVLIKELNKYIESLNKVLIIGLGNRKSTPDSLGPKVLDNILVTSHLFKIGEVEEGYSNVSIFEPNVFGSTGIDSVELIKEVVKLIKPELVIIIDSLCTSNKERLNKTIQITNKGIFPGSGVSNNRGELSSNTLNTNVIAIGTPTVIDIDNFILTPKDIDYIIDNISIVIGNSINKVLHKNYTSTK